MFGKLTLQAIPYDNPIVMGAVALMLVVGLLVAGLLTWFRQWPILWREWLTSVDHKKIGVMYIVLAFVMLLRGFTDAAMMRAQQALAAGDHPGYLPPDHFDQIFTAHGTIMIFFTATPFVIGLMNIVVPLQIGSRDVAFPFLNSVTLWLTAAGAMLVMLSLAVGRFSTAGWTGYPPYSELTHSPSVGVDYWIWALQISGVGTTLTGINFIVTVLKNRAPGMTFMRMPLFTWTALCSSILIVLAFPALTVVLAMLSLDRYLGMHFFTSEAGGNMMNYINLFWIWGHPEVYLLILPAFGIFSEVVPTFSGKRLFGYRSLVWATLVIALLSFTVWLHHFFTMGAGANVNAAFGIATMLIAIPTGVKLFNWLMTMYRGRIRFTAPMLWTLGFIPSFAVGGVTGVMLAVPPVDFMMHNSGFLVAHFHNMLIPGALFGYLAGYMYWFPKVFGFRLCEKWGKRAFWAWLVGFHLAFLPLYVLGLMGMPRRMATYGNPEWQPYLIVAAAGAALIFVGIVCLVVQLVVSIRARQELADITGDPWDGRTLEWATDSPPPVYNFAVVPTVRALDAFMDRKKSGAPSLKPERFEDVHLPSNTATGFLIGGFAFLLGFALVWHIGWLAGVSVLGGMAALIARSFADDTEYRVPAETIEALERVRWRKLESAGILSTPQSAPVARS